MRQENYDQCSDCYGTRKRPCKLCNGAGGSARKTWDNVMSSYSYDIIWDACPNCFGDGSVPCETCEGTGSVKRPPSRENEKLEGSRTNTHNYSKVSENTLDRIYRDRARRFVRNKEYSKAINELTKAIDYDPDAFNYKARGEVYAEINNHRQAIDDFTTAIKLFSKYHDAYLKRANSYIKLKEYDKAIKDINFGMNGDDKYLAFLTRGDYYYAIRSYKQASIDYTNALTHAKFSWQTETAKEKIGFAVASWGISGIADFISKKMKGKK